MSSLSAAKRQAQLEAEVQYGPQSFALSQLLRDAGADYKTTVRQARGAHRGISRSLRAARPVLRHSYNSANKGRKSADKLVNQHIAMLKSRSVDDFRAAIAREQGGARVRFREARRNAMKELTDRELEAASGEAFAVRNARSVFQSAKARIGEQALALASQRGAFTSAAINDILAAARKEATTRRGQDLTYKAAGERNKTSRAGQKETARHNRATEAQAAADAAKKAKKGGLTAAKRREYETSFDKAYGIVGQMNPKDSKGRPVTQGKAVSFLASKGIPQPIALAAWQMRKYKGVGPKTRSYIAKHYGLHKPGFPARFPGGYGGY